MGSLCWDVLLLTLLLVCVKELCAQAPGDEETRCTVQHSSPPSYPDTERNLMDSYNYEDLVPGNGTESIIATAVWNDYSFDGNDADGIVAPTYWQQLAGGLCRFQARVCGWRQNGVIVPQDNWLFTQHIRQDFDSTTYDYNVTIHVFASYSGPNCRERNGCRQRFNLLHYFTNTPQLPSTEGTGYMNRENYQRFVQPTTLVTTSMNTYSFTLPPSFTGLYIAVQDIGACLTLSRLRVYRNNCKSREVGLVRYPDAPPPSNSSSADIISVSCVPNSSVRGSGYVTCGSDGNWGPGTPPQCECDDGFQEIEGSCIPCQEGEFKVEDMKTCRPCPANATSTDTATSVCQCIVHHYRARNESATSPCTAHPSRPKNLTAEVTNTSVSVSWELPDSNGGRTDMLFRVSLCPVLNCVESETRRKTTPATERSCLFVGLSPTTKYRVVVVAENGVSDQDERVDLRKAEIEVITAEGRPEEPHNPTAFSNIVVLVWGPPKVRNGEITGYEVLVEFCASEGDGSGAGNETDLLVPTAEDVSECKVETHKVGPDSLFLVVNSPGANHTLTYTIRAKTGDDRYGDWSPKETIFPDFVPTPPPPTCPTVECTTPPPNTTSIATPSPTEIPTSTTQEPTVANVDESRQSSCGIEECIVHMGLSASAMLVVGILISCVFSCTIAYLCHKHKMKSYKIRVKKHLQSKWDY